MVSVVDSEVGQTMFHNLFTACLCLACTGAEVLDRNRNAVPCFETAVSFKYNTMIWSDRYLMSILHLSQ